MQKAIKIEYRVKCGPKETRIENLYHELGNPTIYDDFLAILKSSSEIDKGIVFFRSDDMIDGRIKVCRSAVELVDAFLANERRYKFLKVVFYTEKAGISTFYIKNNGMMSLSRVREHVSRGLLVSIDHFDWEYVANVPEDCKIFETAEAAIKDYLTEKVYFEVEATFHKTVWHSRSVVILDKDQTLADLVRYISNTWTGSQIKVARLDSNNVIQSEVCVDVESALKKLKK